MDSGSKLDERFACPPNPGKWCRRRLEGAKAEGEEKGSEENQPKEICIAALAAAFKRLHHCGNVLGFRPVMLGSLLLAVPTDFLNAGTLGGQSPLRLPLYMLQKHKGGRNMR